MIKLMFTILLSFASQGLRAEGSVYDLKYKGLDGKQHALSEYRGKTLVIVNTASHCGYTGQYKGLQSLYDQYKQKGLVVLGFPSSSFGQEFGKDEEVGAFCKKNFGVTFPMGGIVEVTGKNKSPIFKALVEGSDASDKSEIRWNFEKFLVDKNGKVAKRFLSSVNPNDQDFQDAVKKLLQ